MSILFHIAAWTLLLTILCLLPSEGVVQNQKTPRQPHRKSCSVGRDYTVTNHEPDDVHVFG